MNKQLDFEPIELDELDGVLGGSTGENNGCGITNGKCAAGGCGLFNGKCGLETIKRPDDTTIGTVKFM